MADPLSLAASITALLELTAGLVKYINSMAKASDDKKRLSTELCNTTAVLSMLQDLIQHHGEEDLFPVAGTLQALSGMLVSLEETIMHLQSRLNSNGKFKRRGALLWPFHEGEVREVLTAIERQKTSLGLALQNIQVRISRTIVEGVKNTQTGNGQRPIENDEAFRLLSAPNPLTNHRTACELREPRTCLWFIESERFNRWLNEPSVLLLSGIPGCGKTILCSAVIQHVKDIVMGKSELGLAYFYFDFHNDQKQTVEGLLISIIIQLAFQQQGIPKEFDAFCYKFKGGQQRPSTEEILNLLAATVKPFRRVYLVVDALDECYEQKRIGGIIADVTRSNQALSILITSRETTNIEWSALKQVVTNTVDVSLADINIDIRTYVQNSLSRDPVLGARPNRVKAEIEAALTSGSQGMFRWAECQLELLRSCLTLASVRKTLSSMPKTLAMTYDAILERIASQYEEQAYSILRWLAFCVRPLRLAEVAEVLVIRPGVTALSEEGRLFCAREVLAIGSSLVRITNGDEVRLAHYSVKEYLMSVRLKSTPLSSFYMMEIPAHQHIAHACITYLLLLNKPDSLSQESFLDLPLLSYAATHWHEHAKLALKAEHRQFSHDSFFGCLLQLIDEKQDSAYLNWLRVSDPDNWGQRDLMKRRQDVPGNLYYMALLGLYDVVETLIDRGADVNARGGQLGSALQAAAFRNRHETVKLLLNNGSEIIGGGGLHSTALNAAAVNGSSEAFRILFESCYLVKEGTVDIMGRSLVAAAASGNVDIVKLLLNRGADVNFKGTNPGNVTSILTGNPITAASFQGHDNVVRLLIDQGADVNATGGRYGNPLQAASRAGFDSIVEMLLDSNAEVNAQGGAYGTAIQAALDAGHQSTANLLLKRGASKKLRLIYEQSMITDF